MCALRGPGLEVIDRIDNAAAELAEHRAGTGASMLFKRAAGETKESRGIVRAHEAWRDAGGRRVQERSPFRSKARADSPAEWRRT